MQLDQLDQLPLEALGATLAQRDATGLIRLSRCARYLRDGLRDSLRAAEKDSEERLLATLGMTREELADTETETVTLPATLPAPQRHHLAVWLPSLAHVVNLRVPTPIRDFREFVAVVPLRPRTDGTLDLSSKGLGDPELKLILRRVATTGLTSLELTYNQIQAEGGVALASMLADTPSLTSLDLANNYVRGAGARRLADAVLASGSLLHFSGVPIARLRPGADDALTELDLDTCGLQDAEAIVLAELLARNATLTDLTLSNNEIRDEGGVALGKALKANKTLTHLDMGRNHTGSRSAVAMGKALMANDTLTLLDMSANLVGDKGAVAIGRALRVNASLTELSLGSNDNISDQAARRLADDVLASGSLEDFSGVPIARLRANTLAELDLSTRSCGCIGVAEGMVLAALLNAATELKMLKMDENVCALEIFHALKLNTTLTCLSLYGDSNGFLLGNDGAVALADALKTNASLETLCVAGNQWIDDLSWAAIAQALAQNVALTALDLEKCDLGVNGPEPVVAIATAIAFNRHLTSLNLGSNEIELGDGRDAFEAMVKALTFNNTLVSLNLKHNRIDGAAASALVRAATRPTRPKLDLQF